MSSWQSVQKKSNSRNNDSSRFSKHHSLLKSPEFTNKQGMTSRQTLIN